MSQGKNVGQGGRQRKCQQCGAVFHGHFCGVCGAKVVEDVEFCPVCGQDREAHTLFCTNCGFSFGREMPERPVAVEVPKQAPVPHDSDESRKYRIYITALLRVSQKNTTAADVEQSIADLTSILDYQESQQRIEQLKIYLVTCREREAQAKIKAEERDKQRKERRKKALRISKVAVPATLSVILLLVLTFTVFIPAGKMGNAKKMVESGQYDEAIAIYEALNGFGKSEQHLEVVKNIEGIQNARYDKSIKNILSVGVPVKIIFEMNGGTFDQATGLEKQIVEQTYLDSTDFDGVAKPTKKGTTFTKWEFGGIDYQVGEVFQINLTAIWQNNSYRISYNLGGGEAGGHNPTTYFVESDDIALISPTKEGHTFLGWTGTGVDTPTPHVTIPKGSTGNRSYTAHWKANTYTITFDAKGGEMSVTSLTVTYREEYRLPTPTIKGYTFIGWYSGSTSYRDGIWEFDYGIHLEAKWIETKYNITYNLNGGKNDTTNLVTFTINDTFTLAEPTKSGYTFYGWTYKGQDTPEKMVTIPEGVVEDLAFTAHWLGAEYTISLDVNGGECDTQTLKIREGEIYALPAPIRHGYVFTGWFYNDSKIASKYWDILGDITLKAKWVPIFTSATTYVKEDGYIYFGEYPQTIKEEGVTITNTQDERGYYLGSDGLYYAKIVATPYDEGYAFSSGSAIKKDFVYYFKVEPIRWKVLIERDNTAFLLCDSIIDNQIFDANNNNYAESDIRVWLNEAFYETAFSDLQKAIIFTTMVDNSAQSTGEYTNPYACENTSDKIFLPSYLEVINSMDVFTDKGAQLLTSDYARTLGVQISLTTGYYGNGGWFVRSPSKAFSYAVRGVDYAGGTHGTYVTYYNGAGVVPALWIQLSGVAPEPTPSELVGVWEATVSNEWQTTTYRMKIEANGTGAISINSGFGDTYFLITRIDVDDADILIHYEGTSGGSTLKCTYLYGVFTCMDGITQQTFEFTASTPPPEDTDSNIDYTTVVIEGENTLYFSFTEIAADKATRTLAISADGAYLFKSSNLMVSSICDKLGNVISRNTDYSYTLEPGEYFITFMAFSMLDVVEDTPQTITVEEHACAAWNDDGTCQNKSTCVICGKATGELAPDVHNYAPGTCVLPATCSCGITQGEALGHLDKDSNYLCDRTGCGVISVTTNGSYEEPYLLTSFDKLIYAYNTGVDFCHYSFVPTVDGTLTIKYPTANCWLFLDDLTEPENNKHSVSETITTFPIVGGHTYIISFGVWMSVDYDVIVKLSFEEDVVDDDDLPDIEIPENAELQKLVMGNNNVQAKNVVFVYEAEKNVTLLVTQTTCVFELVVCTYSVNGDVPVAIEVEGEVVLALNAGDILTIVAKTEKGYTTIVASEQTDNV